MKKLVKGLVKGLILAGVFAVGVATGTQINNQPVQKVIEQKPVYIEKESLENVGVEFVWEQKGDVQELENYYLEDGDIVVEFTDGSWALCNEKENMYVFQPVDLGDWDYHVDNAQQLENIIKTYLSMKNTGMY